MAALFLICAGLLAQSGTGTILGHVRNSAGRVLPGAAVTLVDKTGATVRVATAGSDGAYRISCVPAGAYSLDAECKACAPALRRDVVVRNGQTVVLDFILKPEGGASPAAGRSPDLGQVRLDERPEFRPGQLTDPDAAGGYSDSARGMGNEMVNQYIRSARISPGKGAAARGQSATADTNPDEANLESTGASLLAQHNYQAGMRLFERATSLYPRSARLRMGLGVSLYGQGRYPEAVTALSATARLDPDDTRVYVLLSEADQFSTKPEPQALSILKEFAETHARRAEAHYAYGMDLWHRFRLNRDRVLLNRARLQLEKAVALAPEFADAHLQLGAIYDAAGMADRAVGQYRQAVRLEPDAPTAHYRLAHDYLRLGMKKDARAEQEAYEKLRGESGRDSHN